MIGVVFLYCLLTYFVTTFVFTNNKSYNIDIVGTDYKRFLCGTVNQLTLMFFSIFLGLRLHFE